VKLRELLALLVSHHVEFVVVGGVALIARGVQRSTEDLDVVYSRDDVNLARLAGALSSVRASLRDVDKGLPFVLDQRSLKAGLNFTLDTDLGPLDLFGELAGLGGFDSVNAAASPVELEQFSVRMLSLDGLERAKRAAGRPKDLVDLGSILKLKRMLKHT
jgi:hypothetical protein